MPRTRSLRPGFFKNELLVELPFETRLLFAGLWTLADREGRLEDRPKKIKMEIFPADNLDVNELLDQLADKEFITRYQVEGKSYLQVNKFLEHQTPHVKEPESVIPKPVQNSASPCKDGARTGKVRTAVISNKSVSSSKGEGSGEGGKGWVDAFYVVFRDRWNEVYPGQSYDDVRQTKDFVNLARIQNNRALTPENWATACRHYFASPQQTHTLADLATRFSTFLKHPLDRFNKPVGPETSNGKPSYTDRQNAAIREVLAGIRPTGWDSVDDPVGVQRGLPAPGASRGGTGDN